MNRIVALARAWYRDALVLLAVGLVAYGLAQYSPPLAPIVIGVSLLAAVRLGST